MDQHFAHHHRLHRSGSRRRGCDRRPAVYVRTRQTAAFARRVARNIQIVCQEESHLGRVNDPAGGSWYVENLTEDMAKKAWEIFQDIEARGGMLAGLTSGYIQDMIAKTAEARAKSIATLRQELTGVSAFPILGDDGVKVEPWPQPPGLAVSNKAAITVTPLGRIVSAKPSKRCAIPPMRMEATISSSPAWARSSTTTCERRG